MGGGGRFMEQLSDSKAPLPVGRGIFSGCYKPLGRRWSGNANLFLPGRKAKQHSCSILTQQEALGGRRHVNAPLQPICDCIRFMAFSGALLLKGAVAKEAQTVYLLPPKKC